MEDWLACFAAETIYVSNDGQVTWTVLADSTPTERYYETTNMRSLGQQKNAPRARSAPRPPGTTKSQPSAAAKADKPAESSSSSSSIAIEKRFQEIEKRLTLNEQKISETEVRLTRRLDDGFSQVLSQLTNLTAVQLPSQPSRSDSSVGTHKRSDVPQQTPHKGGPRKEPRTDQ
jgi:cytoskeletal protein RodZ